VEVRRGRAAPLRFPVKDHVDVGAGLGMLDFDAAAKSSGRALHADEGPLARLHRAIAQFMLDIHTGEHGYTEVVCAFTCVNADSMRGTGQLPKSRRTCFRGAAGRRSKFLPCSGTAEVPVTNIVRDEILPAGKLPLNSSATRPVPFRAGSTARTPAA